MDRLSASEVEIRKKSKELSKFFSDSQAGTKASKPVTGKMKSKLKRLSRSSHSETEEQEPAANSPNGPGLLIALDGKNAATDRIPVTTKTDKHQNVRSTNPEELCHRITYDFVETALNLCSERFIFTKASEIMAYELRSTWLTIMALQFMDTVELDSFESLRTFGTKSDDDQPALPPKFDFWSHGTLEQLPRKCRESIMDPFLRDRIPSFTESSEFEDISEQLTLIEQETVDQPSSAIDSSSNIWPTEKEGHCISGTSASPALTEYSDDPWTWSSISVSTGMAGGGEQLKTVERGTTRRQQELSNSENESTASYYIDKKASLQTGKQALEMLYSPKNASNEVRATSEISYKMNRGLSTKAGNSDKESGTFKLPLQKPSQRAKI